MIRVLVADDERPVVEGISHIVRTRPRRRNSRSSGTASSGQGGHREGRPPSRRTSSSWTSGCPASPGLDAIREIRKRGLPSAFILITAYERFDIAREAVGARRPRLPAQAGVQGLPRDSRCGRRQLHRPKGRDRAPRDRAPRARGGHAGLRRGSLRPGSHARREIEAAEIETYRAALGIRERLACVGAAAAFCRPLGALDPELEARRCYEALRRTLRYKTRALVGPCVAGLCALYLPLREEPRRRRPRKSSVSRSRPAHSAELARGRLALAFGSVRALRRGGASWTEALSELLAAEPRAWERRPIQPRSKSDGGWDFEEDEAFLEALLSPSTERAGSSPSSASSRRCDPLRAPAGSTAYRFAALLGSALRRPGAAASSRGPRPPRPWTSRISSGPARERRSPSPSRARFALSPPSRPATRMRSSPLAAADRQR